MKNVMGLLKQMIMECLLYTMIHTLGASPSFFFNLHNILQSSYHDPTLQMKTVRVREVK